MKLFRVLLAIISAFILVCIIAAVVLVVFFDPNKFKPMIIQEVKQKTGYQLEIEGDLGWSFYPILGIQIKQMTLTAPAQSKPFVDLRQVKIAASISQFWERKEKLLGDLHIGEAVFTNLRAQHIAVGLQWQNKVLTLAPITASLYSGSLKGRAQGVELSQNPKWDFDVKLAKIQIEPLLKDFSPNSKLKFSGLGQIDVKAQTQGKSKEEILSHLNGTATYAINNGIFYGIDLNYLIQTADALLNKQPTAAAVNNKQTAFDSISGSAVITNGNVRINKLLMTAPSFTARTDGTINLLSEAVDLQIEVNAQQILKTQWQLPVLVTGSLSQPDVRLDTREIQKMLVKKELEKVKTKVQKQIEKHVPGKAGEFLQKLLGQ